MKVIYKYPIEVKDSFTLTMYEFAQTLSVQVQRGEPQLWAIVEIDAPLVERHFCVRGTGHPLNGSEGHFIGTFQLLEGEFVGHLFEETP